MTEISSTSDHELELRLEKMRLEIAEMKRSQPWNRGVGFAIRMWLLSSSSIHERGD